MSELEAIIGRYVNIEVDGRDYRIFFEEAGSGIPLFCLHTAGADSRQPPGGGAPAGGSGSCVSRSALMFF